MEITPTTTYRAARRAIRPQIGDTLTTIRKGKRTTVRVDGILGGHILYTTQREDQPNPSHKQCDPGNWPKIVIKALRQGSEFRPTT